MVTYLFARLVFRWQSSGEFELLRADACELLVVILSHDDCMKEIFNVKNGKFIDTFSGNSKVYHNQWLVAQL